MVNTTYNLTEDMIIKLQSLKGRIKLKFYEILSNYCDGMNIRRQSGTFQFQEDPFSKNIEGICKIYHEVLLLRNFLQNKPSVKNMKNTYFYLYYTVIKNIDDKEIVDDKYENNYFIIDDIVPNHFLGPKNNQEILKWRNFYLTKKKI